MPYDPQKHHRKSIRLKGRDYARPGWYFITIVTQHRAFLFGEVAGGRMVLNSGGKMAQQCWLAIPSHFPHAILDEFVIMPNHVHGIIHLVDMPVGAKNFSPPLENENQIAKFESPSRTIGSIVRGYKIGVTKWFRHNTDVHIVWQRNYWEHIIRDQTALNNIRNYIINNPVKWQADRYFDR